jgi:hypothetical protein
MEESIMPYSKEILDIEEGETLFVSAESFLKYHELILLHKKIDGSSEFEPLSEATEKTPEEKTAIAVTRIKKGTEKECFTFDFDTLNKASAGLNELSLIEDIYSDFNAQNLIYFFVFSQDEILGLDLETFTKKERDYLQNPKKLRGLTIKDLHMFKEECLVFESYLLAAKIRDEVLSREKPGWIHKIFSKQIPHKL